jgi:hypothetical protein
MNRPIVLSSVGCCLVDSIYDGVSFTSGDFKPFISRTPGDGGLTPGHLILEGISTVSPVASSGKLFRCWLATVSR